MTLAFTQQDIDFFDILATLPTGEGSPGQIQPVPNITASYIGNTPITPKGDVKQYIRSIFLREGLPASLADWAYDTLVEGASAAEMTQRMYDRPEFQERFAGLFGFRQNFPNAPAIGPSEILAWERQAIALMSAANMPPSFYDHWSDFVPLISKGWTIQGLAERVNEGYERVASGPRGVREAFANFFGAAGDSALAAMFIDPNKALPALRQQVAAAEAAGAGFNFGFTLGRDRAMEIGLAGFNYSSAQDRFAGLARLAPLFLETAGEGAQGQDLRAEDEGAASAFALEGAADATQKLERRLEQRVADFSGAGGAMGTSRSGMRGLGPAR